MNLDKLDLSSIAPRTHIHVIGKRGTGKSYLVRNLIHQLRIIRDCDFIVVSPCNGTDYPNIPRYYSIAELSKSDKKIDSSTILVFDDCFASNYKSSRQIQELINNKYVLNVIFIAQTTNLLPTFGPVMMYPYLTFIFRENFMTAIERLHHKLEINVSIEQFQELIDLNTNNWGTLVIRSDRPQIQIQTFRAEDHLTLWFELRDAGLYLAPIQKLMIKIELGYSMFHTIDGDLYDALNNKINEISAMVHSHLCLKQIRMLPTDVNLVIMQMMIDNADHIDLNQLNQQDSYDSDDFYDTFEIGLNSEDSIS